MTGNRETDAALMRRVAAGDRRACRRLVEAHLGAAAGLAGRMLGDGAAAEDVAQEAFFRLWRHAAAWRPDARIATWLYRVVHNLSIDILRGRDRLSDAVLPDVPDPATGPAGNLQRRQIAALVEAHIAALPERQRTAITLVHHQETGNIEAAAIMGLSVEALESLLARGRRRLRESLAAHEGDLRGDLE